MFYIVDLGEAGVYIQQIDLANKQVVKEGEYDTVDSIKSNFPDFPIVSLEAEENPPTIGLSSLPAGIGILFKGVNFSIDGQSFNIWNGEELNIPNPQTVGGGVIAPSVIVNYDNDGNAYIDLDGVLVAGGCSQSSGGQTQNQNQSQNQTDGQTQNAPIVVQLNSEQLGTVVRATLNELFEERNSDLIRVIKDCPYIPIRSLNGTQGSIYGDGENITLSKLGKTFKVVGSFHIVRDTDLNLTTAYALALSSNVEPSLILPEPVLKQLQG